MNNQIVRSQQARKAISIGYKNHWRFRVLGVGAIPNEAFYENEWWFEPITPDISFPREGKERLDALNRAGIRFQGVVIAHEAPKLITAQLKEKKKTDFKIAISPDIVTILGSLASAFVMLTTLVFSVFVQAILIDPALIVVLEDGTWVEVMTWYE